MSKLKDELSLRMISFLAWLMIRIIGHTCRFRVVGYENVTEQLKSGRGFIMAVWHGRTMLPLYYCRKLGLWAITSLSRDGEIQTRIVSRLGFRIIRGSTGRGAVKAALVAAKRLEEGGVLALTPDGPKGPTHEVQEGIVFLAKRGKCPIIPLGVGVRPRKVLPAWDSYAFPMPFARAAIIFGEPIYLGDEDPDTPHAETIKNALNDLEQQAQRMVKEI